MSDVDLSYIKQEINRLHERSTDNKVNISAHEAVCEERYRHICDALEKLTTTTVQMQSSIDELKDLASQGRTSLRTVLWLGGFVAAIITLVVMVADYFK
jgi:hypothetical protein